jgi:hypothetical protein
MEGGARVRQLGRLGLLLLLAGCGQPQAGVAIESRSGGVVVSPTVSGSIGGLSVSVSG